MYKRQIVEGHLKDSFGSARLADVRRGLVEQYVTERSGEVSPGTVIRELNVLKHLLNCAVAWELIPVNHAHGAKPPKAVSYTHLDVYKRQSGNCAAVHAGVQEIAF